MFFFFFFLSRATEKFMGRKVRVGGFPFGELDLPSLLNDDSTNVAAAVRTAGETCCLSGAL